MHRTALMLALALPLLACGDDDDDAAADPPLAVPGVVVTQPPPAQPGMPQPGMMGAPPTFEVPLAVPGQPRPLPLAQPQMPPGMQPGQVPPGMQPGQVPPGMQPGQVPPGMQPGQPGMQPSQMPMAAPITLAMGFQPDPHVVRGTTVGQVPASTISTECAGSIPSQPSHVVSLSTDFAQLRFLVSSTVDTTLVIRGPDGVVRCNDDTVPGENVNPTIAGAFAPGPYTIWVGTWNAGATATYVFGLTEIASVTHASLGS